jgi:hypothetical protein
VGALLFDGHHQIGTLAGAIAVSRDIRATGARRLRRVDAIAKPVRTARLAIAWIGLERRLVKIYASTTCESGTGSIGPTPPRNARRLRAFCMR